MRTDCIVVGYDGSPNARLALEAAADEVAESGVVHVVTGFKPMSQADLAEAIAALPDEFKYEYDPEASEHAQLRDAEQWLQARGVSCRTHLVPDDPATAILDVAEREGADLVVVGSRGAGAVRRFLRGSVSSRVANHSPTSVLIVHDPAAHTDA